MIRLGSAKAYCLVQDEKKHDVFFDCSHSFFHPIQNRPFPYLNSNFHTLFYQYFYMAFRMVLLNAKYINLAFWLGITPRSWTNFNNIAGRPTGSQCLERFAP